MFLGRGRRRALVSEVMNLIVSYNAENCLTA
jgi:hypothetical protein